MINLEVEKKMRKQNFIWTLKDLKNNLTNEEFQDIMESEEVSNILSEFIIKEI